MSRLALYLLGPHYIERDGVPLKVRRRKAAALLAYLVVSGETHSRDALATLFWPEHDQSQALGGLRRTLTSLKRALGEGWLSVDRETAGLNPGAEIWLDVREFQDLLATCHTHGHPPDQVCPACLAPLAEAAALYRDDFLAGLRCLAAPALMSGSSSRQRDCARTWRGRWSAWPTATARRASLNRPSTMPGAGWRWIPCTNLPTVV